LGTHPMNTIRLRGPSEVTYRCTIALQKGTDGWRIKGWVWSKHQGLSNSPNV
jgi:hypothetical protein